MKLTKLVEEGRGKWYDKLDKLVKRLYTQPSADKFEALSRALGHDPNDEDGLSPSDLLDDRGWTWDCVREQFLQGRGNDDVTTSREVLQAIGGDLSGAPDTEDFDQFIEWVQTGNW